LLNNRGLRDYRSTLFNWKNKNMTDINLATSNTNIQPKSFDKNLSVNIGTVIAIILFLLAIAAYGFLYFYNKNLKSKITIAEEGYTNEIKKLTSDSNLNVFDFQNRIGLAKKTITDSNTSLGVLGKVEQDILPDVYLNSFSYDNTNKALDFSCVINGFNTYAKQIASFKNDDYFSEVNSGGATLNKDGKWETTIKLKIK
jgi:hypothetical protein